jgi:hypothetical protein
MNCYCFEAMGEVAIPRAVKVFFTDCCCFEARGEVAIQQQ